MKLIEQLEHIDEARFLAIYQSLTDHGFGPLDAEVARQLKFRPQAIKKLPLEQRARRARQLLASRHHAELCYDLFGTYLIKNHRDLVIAFLDATGVKHQDGMIEDLDHNQPAADEIAGAVAELDRKHDADDVTLYLSLCAEQWPGVPELDRLWRARLAPAPGR